MNEGIRRLNDMLKDENSAPLIYEKLKKSLPLKYSKVISQIQQQEKNHYRILRRIKMDLMKGGSLKWKKKRNLQLEN